MSEAIVVLDTCIDLQVKGQPETYCCGGCIDEDEGGWVDHRYSFLHEGRWVDAGFCCCRHYGPFKERTVARLTSQEARP